jgi:hypothetical protein
MLEKLQPECVHVWSEVTSPDADTGTSNTARRALETLKSASGVVAAAAEAPMSAALGRVKVGVAIVLLCVARGVATSASR